MTNKLLIFLIYNLQSQKRNTNFGQHEKQRPIKNPAKHLKMEGFPGILRSH